MKQLSASAKALIVTAAVLLVGGSILTAYFLVGSSDSSTTTQTTASTMTVDTASSDIDWSKLPTTNVSLTDSGYTIKEAGTYVLNGSSTGSVTVNSEGNVRIILNGVTINSTSGAAIVVAAANNTVIELASGTTNTVSDSATRSDEEIDGAIYSADDLFIQGDGTLNVTANYADGIVGKDDLTMTSGTLHVTAADDGIRGKDSVTIAGGTITVDAKGDGIKSSNDTDLEKGYTYIKGGTVTVTAGDDGVKGETRVVIDGGTVHIQSSVEGIEAANITINNGTIDLYASDDGINASADAMGTTLAVTINGGDITVEVGSGDTDGIDSNGDVAINGGTVRITYPSTPPASGVDYTGTATFNGGTLILNGTQVSEIPAEQMGGMRR